MKLIFIDKQIQDSTTLEPQLIDGKRYHWCVTDEMSKIGETFQEWWIRKQEYMTKHPKGGDAVIGMFFYDLQPIAGIVGKESQGAMIMRYAWMKKDSEII